MNTLESEFLEYQATTDDEFPVCFDEDDKPMRTDHIWHQISKQIDLYSGQHRFKYLAEFPRFLLLISHSYSYCESILSGIGKIFTDGRHNLGKDATQGHASISVYTETTFIRNNLLGIMIPRKVYHVMNGSQQTLSLFKQNLYKQNLHTYKNLQQLMRTPNTELL